MTANHPDTEAALEAATVDRFRSMGYEVANLYHETFGSNSSHGREASSEVVFTPRLRKAIKVFNPELPADVIESAIERFTRDRSALNPVVANQEIHALLKNGLPVNWKTADGEDCSNRVRFIDWDNPANNEFFLAQQMWVSGDTPNSFASTFSGRPLLISSSTAFRLNSSSYRLAVSMDGSPHSYYPPLGVRQIGVTSHYRYRGTDPAHRDNVGLRKCGEQGIPLIYLYGMVPGEYLPVWPVYIVGDDPVQLTFTITADDKKAISEEMFVAKKIEADDKRKYITREVQQRLHQQGFREQVLRAYQERCSICRLQHQELLEAAHIVSDKHPLGQPIIPNGLALCKLHHAAFDRNILGISPDYVVDIRKDILEEVDGPMLKFGLQQILGQTIGTPKVTEWKPSKDLLAIRFEEFKKAG